MTIIIYLFLLFWSVETQQKHLHTRNIQLHKNKYNKIIFKLNYAMNIKWLTNSQNTIMFYID